LTGPGSVGAGEVSTVFTVTVQDQYGNLSNVTADTLFSVQTTAGGTGGFYSDSLGANPITGRAISTGSNTAVFYYRDTSIGDPTITVTRISGQDLSVVSDTLDISVIPGGLSYFAVTGDNSIMSSGESRVITVTAYDVENNPKTDLTQMNIYFGGANASPSPSQVIPTCSNNNSVDVAFGSVVLLEFTNGAATTELKVYNVETVHIKAMNDPTSPTVTTSDSQDLDIVVGHGSAKYLKFSADIPIPAGDFLAGIEFPLGELRAMDLYDNLCDGADVPADGYSGTKAINYTLSGTADAPDGSAIDIWTNNVAFTAGVSTTVLNTTLYRAQDTAITAAGSDLTGTNIASNIITVSAGAISKLSFYEQPTTSCLTNTNLAQQPVVAVADQYGNPVFAASDQITISASLTSGTYTPVSNGVLSGDSLQVIVSGGVATFSGIKYSYPESIYLRASGGSGTDVYSYQIVFSLAPSDGIMQAGSLLEPADIASTVDSSGERINIFDFRITDSGSDGYGIDLTQIAITRDASTDTTGGWASYIAGAYISDGLTVILGTVTDNVLTFGDAAS
ncbi:MAG: hypothetical protein KAS59_06155, partial [Alphaproteobacteria bacterium]|nr:hypothetical protein [Alphaproteobacteria bacterium]